MYWASTLIYFLEQNSIEPTSNEKVSDDDISKRKENVNHNQQSVPARLIWFCAIINILCLNWKLIGNILRPNCKLPIQHKAIYHFDQLNNIIRIATDPERNKEELSSWKLESNWQKTQIFEDEVLEHLRNCLFLKRHNLFEASVFLTTFP